MRATLLPISALLLGVAILVAGNGLQGVLIPVRGGLENFQTSIIGLFSTAFSLGYVFSCYLTPRMVRRVGHIRSFAVLSAIAASMILLIGLLVSPIVWVLLRVVSGFCLAGLYMVIESWLNEKSTNDNRGQIFAVYMVISLSAITLGQMTLPLGEPTDNVLFVVTGIAILLALVPVSLTTSAAPAPIADVKLRLGRLYRMSPVGILGCFFVGMANGAYSGMGAVFGQKLAFSVLEVSLFMSASLIGGALAQVPIGRLSDKFDRRAVMIGVCAGAAVIGTILAFAGGFGAAGEDSVSSMSNSTLIMLVGLLGCFIYTMYALCVAHTNDFIASHDFVEASGGLLLTYGIGATIGPFVAAVLMQIFGVGALFLFTTTIHLLFLSFALYRMTRRAALPPAEREQFVQTAAPRTTPAVIALDPRCPEIIPEDVRELVPDPGKA